LARKGTRDPA